MLVLVRVGRQAIGHPDHPYRYAARAKRYAKEGANGRMALRLPDTAGVVHRVDAAHRPVFQHGTGEETRPQRDQVIMLVELRARLESLDRHHVHRSTVRAIQADEAKLRGGEVQAMPECSIEHL